MVNGGGVLSSNGVVRSSFPDKPIPDLDLATFIWNRISEYADQTALECGVSGRSYSFREARSLSRRFGASLMEKGLGSGDVLAVMLPNMIEYPVVLLGALEAGLIVTTIYASFKTNEVRYQLETTEAKAIVVVLSFLPVIAEVFQTLGTSLPIILVDDDGKGTSLGKIWSFRDLTGGSDTSATSRRFPEVSPDALALLPCSSGTTSLRKVVARTHRIAVASITLSSHHSSPSAIGNEQSHRFPGKCREVFILNMPMDHTFGLSVMLSRLYGGYTQHVLPSGDLQIFAAALSKQQPLSVTWYCSPHTIPELNSLVKTEDLKSLRRVIYGGCKPVQSQIEGFRKKLPNQSETTFIHAYALTEAVPMLTSLPNETDPKCPLFPVPNTELKVVDSSGATLGPGQEGELYVRGPQVMKCYYKNESETSKAFDNGWLKTGDLVYFDKDGMFYVVGRLKELIKIHGLSVSSVELELVLLDHPSIADAGVVGVPDEVMLEKAVAFVVPKSKVTIDPEQVRQFVASQVAPYKILSEVVVTESLPRNPTGKMLKRVLKEQYSLMKS